MHTARVGGASIPFVFAGMMVLEFIVNVALRTRYQTLRASAVSIMVELPHYGLISIVPIVWLVGYRAAAPFIPWQMPADAWWIWPVGIVVMDFAAYWMHRYHHALNLTWAAHSVHHSAPEFALPTGGRSSIIEPFVNLFSGAYLILIAPVLIGLPLPAALLGWLVKDTWGFAVHTRTIRKLGWLEYVLATPSHHRVHHAINDAYIGKNYAFVFIFWDKLFGTFTPERDDISPNYGLIDGPTSMQPLAVGFHEARKVWRDAVATRRWRDKLRVWYMPAGWRPADATPRQPMDTPAAPLTGALWWYELLQAAHLGVLVLHLLFTLPHYSMLSNICYLLFIVGSTAIVGELLDRSQRIVPLELGRAALVLLVLALTQRWFERPLGGLVSVAMALTAATAIAALVVWQRAKHRPGLPASAP
jgi:sterol desaturase/sphingolipid hydroxylase (fatty acid hydroxylase superfamily)